MITSLINKVYSLRDRIRKVSGILKTNKLNKIQRDLEMNNNYDEVVIKINN